jgi:DNA polymerase II large subunit
MPFDAKSAWERSRQLAPFPAHLNPYYEDILTQYEAAYNIAEIGRSRGFDPNYNVEPRTVFDLADRVNEMLGLDQFEGLADRLRILLKTTSKEKAAISISQEIALGKFGRMDTAKALEYGVRAGLAVITDGVTVAPIQGIYTVSVKQNDDNSSYASVSYAGPMRSAGGTEAAFSLVIADLTAKKLGLSSYRAREEEIGRYTEELRVYEREVGNFQYRVTDEDVRSAISNLPVEIDGVETDPVEVVVHRNLSRVGTDRVRGGALRVLNDGVVGRAHKLEKKLASLNVSGWEWLGQLGGGTQQSSNETEHAGAHFEEVISGRAVLSSPGRMGGFRLRYGRCFNTGLSTIGIHPALPTLLDFPVVVGTQVKVDQPGKAATIAFVDSIDGPTVLLRDGSVRRIDTVGQAEEVHDVLAKVIDLGDVLISFGDFLESNKNLPPSPYVIGWWAQDVENAFLSSKRLSSREDGIYKGILEKVAADPIAATISAEEALTLSRELNVPLHPRFSYHFDRLSASELLEVRRSSHRTNDQVEVDITSHHIKLLLEHMSLPHRVEGSIALVEGDDALIFAHLFALDSTTPPSEDYRDAAGAIRELSGIRIGRQTTTTVGVRVGRPEKAMLRHLKPPVHTLFPVGPGGGPSRNLLAVIGKEETVEVDIVNLVCPSCGARRTSIRCDQCGEATQRFLTCPRCNKDTNDSICPSCKIKTVTHSKTRFNLRSKLEFAIRRVPHDPSKPVKGVRGLTSQSKMPESLEKGIIRSNNGVYVYKDGTMRIDVTNAPLTHFRPRDIKADLQTLLKLGYTEDYRGEQLTRTDQILEIKPQDVILPIDIADDLVRMANFIDEELTMLYGTKPFYEAKEVSDLIGRIVIGLAPHTSVGVAGRIIGFASTQVCFASPCWHAAKRRDCDGDGDSLLLLLDTLLNFSTEYIPDQIGGLMDTPLLIQPIIIPAEVDNQAHNFDIASRYPREFYEATQNNPPAVSLEPMVETIGRRLTGERQFFGFGFTHSTSSITIKRSRGSYSTLRTLAEKIAKQIEVADKIEAVSTKEVVESIIRTHLIRDIMGNTKKYASQAFKCKGCGATYRRPPISSRCDICGSELRETLTQASVEKYLATAQRLAREYNVDEYLRSRLEMAQRELDQLFPGRGKSTQMELTEFANSI